MRKMSGSMSHITIHTYYTIQEWALFIVYDQSTYIKLPGKFTPLR